jgi:hypothetical protein
MGGEILAGEIVCSSDVAIGADQITDTAGKTHLVVVLAFFSFGLIRTPDFVAFIADQRVGKTLIIGEGLLVGDRTEGCSDYGTVCCFKFWGSITEPATLKRSTRRSCLGVPPHGYPFAGQIRERDGVAVLVGRRKFRSPRSYFKHPLTLALIMHI